MSFSDWVLETSLTADEGGFGATLEAGRPVRGGDGGQISQQWEGWRR